MKIVNLVIAGAFNPQQTEDFIHDYHNKISNIDVESFNLRVDFTELDAITEDALPKLERSFKLYKESGFKKIVFVIKKSPIIKMRLNTVAKNAGLFNSEVEEV